MAHLGRPDDEKGSSSYPDLSGKGKLQLPSRGSAPTTITLPAKGGANQRVLGGRYRLMSEVGVGGMGVVWLGQHMELDVDVAIKLLPTLIAKNESHFKRFRREARLAARVRHPNTVSIHDFGRDGDVAFIVMEYLGGGSLQSAVEGGRSLPWPEATEVIRDAATGIAAFHSQGITHRDIKPSNLLRTVDKKITKIADFGLAFSRHAISQLTASGAVLGTPAYMAPEQWKSAKVDHRADLYALIATHFTLLTGHTPFDENIHPRLLGHFHLNEPFRDPKSLGVKLPASILDVLECGSRKDPTKRFQTAVALLEALNNLLTPLAINHRAARHASTSPSRQSADSGASSINKHSSQEEESPSTQTVQPVSELALIRSAEQARAEQLNWSEKLDLELEWKHDLGITFRLIPPGRFLMGAITDDRLARAGEKPSRRIEIGRPFWAATFPVVNRIIRHFLETASSDESEVKRLLEDQAFARICRRGRARGDAPCVEVNLPDARTLCEWLASLDGRRYRLPTEGEWEYMARAGAAGVFWWEGEPPYKHAVFGGNQGPVPCAKERGVNEWGLSDTLGNVWEWTCSAYAPLSTGAAAKPMETLNTSSGVVRGGSWREKLNKLRLSHRESMHALTRRDDLGFRVICDLDPELLAKI